LLDSLIIGGGPIGSRTAYKLAAMGYKTAVLEKRDGIGQKPCCTGIVSQECIAKFAIPSNVIHRLANGAKIFSPSGEFLRVSSSKPQAGILNRPDFDRSMAEKAQSQGVEYYLNCRAEHLSILPDRVKVETLTGGQSCYLEAKSIVLAVGFSSPLIKELGFGRVSYFVGGAQTEVRNNVVDEVEVYFDQEVAPGFFAWLVPKSPGCCLAGLLTRHSPGERLRNWISHLGAQGRVNSEKGFQIRYGGIPLRPLPRSYGDRILVVGDAAGQVKPTTGGGIYFGLLCADIAADTLAEAFRSGDLSSRKLSRYQKEWRRKIGHELDIEYFARRAYEHLNNKQIDSLIFKLKSNGVADALLQNDDFSFDWHGGLMKKALKHVALSHTSRFFQFFH
jgi:digeranylgeranylglycerophospholipid reductase